MAAGPLGFLVPAERCSVPAHGSHIKTSHRMFGPQQHYSLPALVCVSVKDQPIVADHPGCALRFIFMEGALIDQLTAGIDRHEFTRDICVVFAFYCVVYVCHNFDIIANNNVIVNCGFTMRLPRATLGTIKEGCDGPDEKTCNTAAVDGGACNDLLPALLESDYSEYQPAP